MVNNVILHVLSSAMVDPHNSKPCNSFNPKVDGKNLSTVEDIKVNKTQAGYTIVYLDSDLNQMDVGNFVSSLLILLMDNLTDPISISIRYHYADNNDDIHIDPYTAISILKINDILERIPNKIIKDSCEHSIEYHRSSDIDTLISIRDDYDDSQEDENDENSIDCGMDTDDDNSIFNHIKSFCEDYDDDEDVISTLSSIIGNIDMSDTNKGKNKNKKSNKSKPEYPRSRIFKDAKNPKKEIKRHGVVVTRDKDDLEKDKKIIKGFLKDFIPGKEGWVKEFRSELTQRWINMYTIKAKDLKKLEKKRKEKIKDKERKKKNKEILDLTRNIFNVPISSWDDPNK